MDPSKATYNPDATEDDESCEDLCAKPSDFCTGDNKTLTLEDCDGDGINDHTCSDSVTGLKEIVASRSDDCTIKNNLGSCTSEIIAVPGCPDDAANNYNP